MKKISTLFKKDPQNLGRVINEVNPENEWAFTHGIPTRKFDGTACAIIEGKLYKRYDVKKGRQVPAGAIPCQEPDTKTGHWPHWVACSRSDNADKYHFEAYDSYENHIDGTYELIGEKVQGNPEKMIGHHLIKHGGKIISLQDDSFEYIKEYLETHDMEGIVFHEKEGERMCKIRKSDFGIKR